MIVPGVLCSGLSLYRESGLKYMLTLKNIIVLRLSLYRESGLKCELNSARMKYVRVSPCIGRVD